MDLVETVIRVVNGEAAFSAADLSTALHQLRDRQAPDADAPRLTTREVEVLRLMSEGSSTEAMAASLSVSVHTVRSHVRHILEKLHAHSKLEAVVIATRDRLIETSSN